jgi:glutamate carboxypeptidase
MDYTTLPLDAGAILAGVRPWVECESPSWDAAAVNRMMDLAATHMQSMGATLERFPGEKGFGDCLYADFNPEDPRPGILLLGHLDTVHPIGTLAGPLSWRQDGNKAYGPGLYDMKSGNYLALEVLRLLREGGANFHLPVRMLLVSDEESGSPFSRPLIERIARNQRFVLVVEGGDTSGNLAVGRYPVARFRIRTYGKSSHALIEPGIGVSALSGLARIVPRVEALAQPGRSLTVNYIQAGQHVAIIPTEGTIGLVSTAKTLDLLEDVYHQLVRIVQEEMGERGEVIRFSNRPLWTPTEADHALWQQARSLADPLDLPFGHDMMFGGSDGNITGALGVPTLDCLGPLGADAHQLTEHILLDSVVPRGRLLAGLLLTLQ